MFDLSSNTLSREENKTLKSSLVICNWSFVLKIIFIVILLASELQLIKLSGTRCAAEIISRIAQAEAHPNTNDVMRNGDLERAPVIQSRAYRR